MIPVAGGKFDNIGHVTETATVVVVDVKKKSGGDAINNAWYARSHRPYPAEKFSAYAGFISNSPIGVGMIKKVVSLFADDCGVITGTRSDTALPGAGYPGRLIELLQWGWAAGRCQ